MSESTITIFNRTFTIKSQWKITFLATWIGGMLAHAYRFFNFLPSWDSMYNFSGTGATYSSGRCFLEFFGKISSKYDMPWVNGALSLFYLCIVSILLTELFELKETWSCILLSLLVVSFPTVTASFAFMFTADGYMMAFLMAVLGIYFTKKYKYGIFPGIICIGLSIGTYQAYISVMLCSLLVIFIQDLFIRQADFKTFFLKNWKYIPLLLGGFLFYKMSSTLINAYYHITLTDYQGIGQIHIMSLWDYKQAFRSVYNELSHLFSFNEGLHAYWYGYFNRGVFLLIILITFFLAVKNKIYRRPLSCLTGFICIACLPLSVCFLYFISSEVWYHTLMEMGACFIYLLLLCYLEQSFDQKIFDKILKTAGILVLSYLSFYNIRNANICYNEMNLSYEKSYSITSNILDRIENLDEFPEISKVAVIGTYHTYSENIGGTIPYIIGVDQDNFLNLDFHYFAMWNYCFGVQLEQASSEEISIIKQTDDYQNLDVYPAKNCIAVINNTIVVKLPE